LKKLHRRRWKVSFTLCTSIAFYWKECC
jgi:hypothetical protein